MDRCFLCGIVFAPLTPVFLTTFRTFQPRISTTKGSFQHFPQENPCCGEFSTAVESHFMRTIVILWFSTVFTSFPQGKPREMVENRFSGGKCVLVVEQPCIYPRYCLQPGFFTPCIAGCSLWKNKSFQHACGKRCGKWGSASQWGAGKAPPASQARPPPQNGEAFTRAKPAQKGAPLSGELAAKLA